MSYEKLIRRYPEYQRLFNRICVRVNDEGHQPAELLPDAVEWLRKRIKNPNDLQEAVRRVNKYLKHLGDDT